MAPLEVVVGKEAVEGALDLVDLLVPGRSVGGPCLDPRRRVVVGRSGVKRARSDGGSSRRLLVPRGSNVEIADRSTRNVSPLPAIYGRRCFLTTTKSSLSSLAFFIPSFLVMSLLGAPSRATAQEWAGSGRIEGIVVDADGQPVPGAEVTLRWMGVFGYDPPTAEQAAERETQGPDPCTTDEKGEWGEHMLANGIWRIVARHPGFGSTTGRVRIKHLYNRGPRGREVRITLPSRRADAVRRLIMDGEQFLASNRPTEARELLETVLPLLDDTAHRSLVLGTIARAHYLEGEVTAAFETLRMAVDLDSGNVEAARVLIELLLGQGDANAALEVADRLVTSHPELPEAWLQRAKARLALGHRDQAWQDLQEVLRLDPPAATADQARQLGVSVQAGND